MKNLNKTIFDRIIIQAEEAKELGLTKLADDVLSAISPASREDAEHFTYSSFQLEDDLHKKLWKIAMDFATYHDLKNIDIQKIDETINSLAKVVSSEIEKSMNSENKVGALEPKLFGQK